MRPVYLGGIYGKTKSNKIAGLFGYTGSLWNFNSHGDAD